MPALTTVTRARQRCGAAPHIDLSNPWRYCLLPAPSAINTALNGLSYNPTADYNGSSTLTITTNDQGNRFTTGGGWINERTSALAATSASP